MAAITLLPIGWQLNRLVVWIYYDGLHIYEWPNNGWITLGLVAAALNVLLTIPIGLLGRLALPSWPWWVVPIAVALLSGGIELAQWMLPLAREGRVLDAAATPLVASWARVLASGSAAGTRPAAPAGSCL